MRHVRSTSCRAPPIAHVAGAAQPGRHRQQGYVLRDENQSTPRCHIAGEPTLNGTTTFHSERNPAETKFRRLRNNQLGVK